MKTIRLITSSILVLFAIQSTALAQSTDITDTFKKHFNKTVQQVQETENTDKKRTLLNESFNKMLEAVDRIESQGNLSKDELAQLNAFKNGILEKKNELNGSDGFTKVIGEDLDDFSEYSQDYMEQADKTLTIGLTTALLIVIILLLL
ncbi:MAG: hypothetical protein GWO07_00800 [Candidatus Dadabacteria bacterium]|nr:hypothetical protein [Candidatus Dadabacteria bacterium]NIT99396.1 hypothetical protein [Nitrosopumilaceae archaeon]NIU85758.1 hypothetical protein [Nitrosopumilaceae archaeon]NIX14494.1 hypothetical protein [Candidatus Dadabacteria bacterium]NIX59999.1 hypothetical protein [Nitrosopumilaceae archaeon]